MGEALRRQLAEPTPHSSSATTHRGIAPIALQWPVRVLEKWKRFRHGKPPWTARDDRLKEVFRDELVDERTRYSELFSYLASGFLYYGSPDRARVYYPGAASNHDAGIDGMEGFCRFLPLVGAWISSGGNPVVRDPDGRNFDLLDVVRDGLLAGTNPASPAFWGHIGDYDQRIVEAADVALSIWLLRGRLWPQLTSPERERIVHWLLEVEGKAIVDNNWHLFPTIVHEVLAALDCGGERHSAWHHYERLKTFYRGNGWFSDGPDGRFDYYNAWGIHYALFWLNLVNPAFDPEFIDGSLDAFVRGYRYLFSPEGFPMTGRSICYRMAAPAPLVAAAARGLGSVSPGMARRALDCVWKYFVARGAISEGRVTQGYWQDDLRLLDNYSGPGSPLWSVRSLVVAFSLPSESEFWMAPQEPLPVEVGDFTVPIPQIQWEIRGFTRTREVRIVKHRNAGNEFREPESHTRLQKAAEFVTCVPFRPRNAYAKSRLPSYSSRHAFWTGPAPASRGR